MKATMQSILSGPHCIFYMILVTRSILCSYQAYRSLMIRVFQDILDNPGFGEVRKYPGMYSFRRAIKKPTPHRAIDMPPSERAALRKNRALNPRLDVSEMTFEELILDQYRR